MSEALHNPIDLLNAWLAVEALQPVTFDRQEDIVKDDPDSGAPGKILTGKALFPFDLTQELMPWDRPEGDRIALETRGLKADQSISWRIPLGFINVETAITQVSRALEPDGPERELSKGLAIVALVDFDEKGRPVKPHALSSFGWACGRILAGQTNQLHVFPEIEEKLVNEIVRPLSEIDISGRTLPTSRAAFAGAMKQLVERLGLPKDLMIRPEYAIRVIGGSLGEARDHDPETKSDDILNSFYLGELFAAKRRVREGKAGDALKSYLHMTRAETRLDILHDKGALDDLLAPDMTPLARWPAAGGAKLVTLQQAAVNGAFSRLAKGGLLAVNGPPGTGKTTLLRDVVANVLCQRAEALASFDDPADAFKRVSFIARSGYTTHISRLDARLKGFGIAVASSNNAAVLNVSAELPQAKAINPDIDVRYFATTASHVANAGAGKGHRDTITCWGLVSAALGNSDRRTRFVEPAWWDKDWGLNTYFRGMHALSRIGHPEEQPKSILAENPPVSRQAALEAWQRARVDFLAAREKASNLRSELARTRDLLAHSGDMTRDLEAAQNAHTLRQAELDQALQTRDHAAGALARAETTVAEQMQLARTHDGLRPHTLVQLIGLDSLWRTEQQRLAERLTEAMRHRDETRRLHDDASARADDLAKVLHAIEAELEQVRTARAAISAVQNDHPRGTYTDVEFWSGAHRDIHLASPWATPEFLQARDAVFVAAMKLHSAFIHAAGRGLYDNLSAIMGHIKGNHPVPSGPADHLMDLWDSFFLLVPVISSTFASFGRLTRGLPTDGLGWLIIDEAGQAAPQQAVGAIMRSKRALVIGDPLQIEPINSLPLGLTRSIAGAFHVAHDTWMAPNASAQTVADAASPIKGRIGHADAARDVGLPLLVHRRCQDPMFSLANRIAYDDLMVHAGPSGASAVALAWAPELPSSAWINVESNARKWSAAEGKVVIALLSKLADAGIKQPDLYIISPFRDVASRLRSEIKRAGVLARLGLSSASAGQWLTSRIGTVHTFQGKEADTVLLVLGASADASNGSRIWAGATPNILNVAATRAKRAFYVIGRHDAWSKAGVFADAAGALPVHHWPGSEPNADIDGAEA